MAEILKCNANETSTCCCVDVGTIIDNHHCTAEYEQLFSSQQEAEKMLEWLTEKARSIESESCQISHSLNASVEGVTLKAAFTFSCEAETLIFQLALR